VRAVCADSQRERARHRTAPEIGACRVWLQRMHGPDQAHAGNAVVATRDCRRGAQVGIAARIRAVGGRCLPRHAVCVGRPELDVHQLARAQPADLYADSLVSE
jgi:hypothetical protein